MKIATNDLYEQKIKTKQLKVLVLLLVFVLLYGINGTYVYHSSLTPFGISVVLALMFVNFNGYILSIIYAISYMLADFSFIGILVIVNVVGVLSLLQLLTDRRKLKISKTKIMLFSLLSYIAYCIMIDSPSKILPTVVSIVLSIFFLYSCICFFDATIGRGMLTHVNLDEKICGAVVLIIFSIGICNAKVSIISIGYIMSAIIILVSIYLVSNSVSLVVGVLIGLGFSIYFVNPIYISLFVVLTLASIAFKSTLKFLSVIAYILSYILFVIFFDLGLSLGEILSVCIGAIIFLLVPLKFLNSIASIFEKSKPVVVQNVFNNSKKELVSRVKELSQVFMQMDKVYRDMVKGNLSDEKAKEMLKEELVSSVCNNCENKSRCFRNSNCFMDNCFEIIVSAGYEKGKLLLLDLPEYLTTNCSRINSLLSYFNNLVSAYIDYKTAVTNVDTSRVLIADQLTGVSRLLTALADEVDINVSFDNKYEKLLKEQLSYSGIICLESLVYEKSVNSKKIVLIVKNTNINDKKIEKTVSKIFNIRFKIVEKSINQIIGTETIVLKNSPNYDVAFGSAVITKAGKVISGDSHSVIPIDDDKFMVSICDGMGSGCEAQNISKLTLSLIENFYRAGFDNDIILSSVNKLLSLNEQERFSTIDLCVIDCRKNYYDFVKLGASDGYIKRSNSVVEVITSSGLPVGVLENIRPHVTKLCISPMDMVVLVSDGVSDALGSSLENIIRSLDTINPQKLAEEILQFALDRTGGIAEDDMTVVCVRVFESV